jgi:hypothetical protein
VEKNAPIDASDPQLAAALKAMIARLTLGEFLKVGQPTSAISTYASRREEIRKRRDALMKDLEKIDQELDALGKAERK